MVSDCSTPTLQPWETCGRRELIDRLTAPASSGSRQSADGNEQQCLMSAAACQPEMPVLYRVHSGMQNTTGTGFAPLRDDDDDDDDDDPALCRAAISHFPPSLPVIRSAFLFPDVFSTCMLFRRL